MEDSESQLTLEYDWELTDWDTSFNGNSSEKSQSLFDTTFVVLDLETTGGSAGSDAIIEIAAVKICQGEIIDRFHTFVNPERMIPEFIINLTGIDHSMVDSAPTIDVVLPNFLNFLTGAIPIAHNAKFDISFLKYNAKKLQLPWMIESQICTLHLARKVLSHDEVPGYKLAVLSKFFATETVPTHQAMDDVLATVEIFYKLLERVGNIVTSYPDLVLFLETPKKDAFYQCKKASLLSANLPLKPGVYIFYDAHGVVLYIGKSINIAQRVKQYFTAQEKRSKIRQMLKLAVRVETVICAHEIEASIRELHLIAHHLPPYNRVSKRKPTHYYLLMRKKSSHSQKINKKSQPILSAEKPYNNTSALETESQDSYSIICLSESQLTPTSLSDAYLLGPLVSQQIAHDVQSLIQQFTSQPPLVNSGKKIIISQSELDVIYGYYKNFNSEFVQYFMHVLEKYTQEEEFEKAAILRDRLANLIKNQAYLRKNQLFETLGKAILAHKNSDLSWDILIIDTGKFKDAVKIAASQNITAQVKYLVEKNFPELNPDEVPDTQQIASSCTVFSSNLLSEQHPIVSYSATRVSSQETLITAHLIYSWLIQKNTQILWSEHILVQTRESNEKFENLFESLRNPRYTDFS